MTNRFSYKLPQDVEEAVTKLLEDWTSNNKVSRLWRKDSSVWTNSGEDNWLGWLDIAQTELEDAGKFQIAGFDGATFENILLLGMGGSSLCPEVLAKTFGVKRFHILDSTVPAQIKTLEQKIDVPQTLFIVASKSGSTLEPNTFKQHFYKLVSDAVGVENAGQHFVAITDPGSKLEAIAKEENFRNIFYGEPTVGGRFSALSVFGMIPAATMGLDAEDFLKRSMPMIDACRNELAADNPGVLLGAILGACHSLGRDKLTIFTSPKYRYVGGWMEQLVAESTGKNGVAIIPVDLEEALSSDSYGEDRLFVFLDSGDDESDLDGKISAIEGRGMPVVRITLDKRRNLGQEFFRWEFATAVAGSVMSINPFDQPDVESAKVEARKITDEYEKTGQLPAEEPFFEENGIQLFTSAEHAKSLNRFVGENKTVSSYLNSHIDHLQENDYFALLAYIEMNDENMSLLDSIRSYALNRELCATCLGFGPRFLHSTGQAYKGGANNGVFLQITADDAEDFEVPGQKYTFGVVKAAQSRGDFQVLLDRGRRALRVHIKSDVAEGLASIRRMLP